MVQSGVLTNQLVLWGGTFALGSIFSWLVWLTIRHYNYGKPAYEVLSGTDLDDGHLKQTNERFDAIETSQSELTRRVDHVEGKVDRVDEKTDRNYRLLEKIAKKADVDGIIFRGGSDKNEPSPGDD